MLRAHLCAATTVSILGLVAASGLPAAAQDNAAKVPPLIMAATNEVAVARRVRVALRKWRPLLARSRDQ